MPPDTTPPVIEGPYRKWYDREFLEDLNIFDAHDIVWWTQSDNSDSQYGGPGKGINEASSWWKYKPEGGGQQDEVILPVQYSTYINKRYGQFSFPASFLEDGNYVISCKIVDKAGNEYTGSWVVVVKKLTGIQL